MSEVRPEDGFLFLETTIQISRVIAQDRQRATIRLNTLGRRLCTSGYVLAEYNRTLIKDAITFHKLLLTSPSVAEAVKRSAKYPQNRKFPRTMVLLATLGFDEDKQNTLDRIERFIDWQAHDLFWESIDAARSIDEVGCVHSQWQAELQETGQYDLEGLRCVKAKPPACGIMTFIEKNRRELDNFISAASTCSRPNVAKAAEAFDRILSGQDTPFGERSCYRVADVLIVLEAPSDAEIYSTDGDVHAICGIIGKLLYAEVHAEA